MSWIWLFDIYIFNYKISRQRAILGFFLEMSLRTRRNVNSGFQSLAWFFDHFDDSLLWLSANSVPLGYSMFCLDCCKFSFQLWRISFCTVCLFERLWSFVSLVTSKLFFLNCYREVLISCYSHTDYQADVSKEKRFPRVKHFSHYKITLIPYWNFKYWHSDCLWLEWMSESC